jgi:nucleotide sugar dehydrogenase
MTNQALLFDKRHVVGVWGNGYIGYSTMLHLAANGVSCIGYDPDQTRVDSINKAVHPVPGLGDWLMIDPVPLLQSGRMRATISLIDILKKETIVHVVAVPTERKGAPWWDPLSQVIRHIAQFLSEGQEQPEHPPLVIIESTLAPGTTDLIVLPILRSHGLEVGRNLLLGIAPRRDWFIAPDKNLRTLDRVYCGFDDRSAVAMFEFLNILCDKLHRAADYRICEMVKCIENAYRHVEIMLANQLSLAYPHIDMREVLRLAGTKWNMGSFQPSFGTGGYCIPLAGQYVLQGATHPELLTILSEAFASDLEMRRRVAQAVVNRGCKSVGILGLSYRGNIKVSVMSPAILIAKHLAESGIRVAIHDPYFTVAEIWETTGLEVFELPEDLDQFDCVLVNADHNQYLDAEVQEAILLRAHKLLVIDNHGVWSQWPWPQKAAYYQPGSSGWLTLRKFGSLVASDLMNPASDLSAAILSLPD